MQPMLATPGTLPAGPEWVYEVAWDGLRVLAEVTGGRVRLTDADGRDVTAVFDELAELTTVAPDVLLDGEVVCLSDGVPSRAALAARIDGRRPDEPGVTYLVYDVLRLYGVELTERTLTDRRGTLERLDLSGAAAVSVSPVYRDGAALWAVTAGRGLAGVVAKRRDSPYRSGRDPRWRRADHAGPPVRGRRSTTARDRPITER